MTQAARFDTLCIHAGQSPDPTNGAIMTPVYFTSTYVQEGLGQNKGFDYARVRNPTRDAVEANLAALEGGAHGMAFGSGMAPSACWTR
jgi:O-acetylhomoserine/O-acetylserine sulfhydrylase-like pyridoxal-dependent enzyme